MLLKASTPAPWIYFQPLSFLPTLTAFIYPYNYCCLLLFTLALSIGYLLVRRTLVICFNNELAVFEKRAIISCMREQPTFHSEVKLNKKKE